MDALHSTNSPRCTDALRSEKVSVNLTAGMAARLERLARRNHWSLSTAAALLIERGLDDDERGRGRGTAA